ncbi:hypothetical protein [Autumnicola musiva]|uniref:Uncharacterized protein n=1 Tax=Autumnicola musiva TaxID=3075589 RepID=A0ABU3D830_9FLAO|nr:hypothetical protein [Zunongwangia sp. F117]MDT0677163.1 hypothetical protein [Zunongwangia sp. F117]
MSEKAVILPCQKIKNLSGFCSLLTPKETGKSQAHQALKEIWRLF